MSIIDSVGLWIILASELIAVWVIWQLWMSPDHAILKVALSLIALIPVLGPIVALWIGNFPNSAVPILRVPRLRGAFFDRWRGVLEPQHPVKRYRSWRDLITRRRNEDP